MKKITLKLILPFLVLTFVIYGCMKEEVLQNSDLPEEDVAELITFQKSEVIPGQYIVVFKEGTFGSLRADKPDKNTYLALRDEMKARMNQVLLENRIEEKEILQAYVKVFQGAALQLSDEEVSILREDIRVDYIEQDQTIGIAMGGPPGGGGGGGDPTQTTPWGISRVGGPANGVGKTAWIIDSGIDLDHNDLNVDVANSQSFLGGNQSDNPDDQNGHGTHVAGTVAAINNSIGVVGVAAGATVVAVRVLDRRGSGSTSGVIGGVDYVAAVASSNDAANMSLGGGVSTSLDNAVIAASSSCPFALAAGNESDHANNHSPARANGSNIYTVSAMSNGDNWASFSNYGNPPVDYCAPGVSILSTYKDNGYATANGTSIASPHVCGILLMGNISSDGTVSGDPDGNADSIAHL